jgi:hypothetical protein
LQLFRAALRSITCLARCFAPGATNMANVAHFMTELVTDPETWADWESKMPVIVNAATNAKAGPGGT